MTVSIGNGVSTGDIVTSETNPVTGGIIFSAGKQIVDNTLLIGEYCDQKFPSDDYTLAATGVVAAQRGYLNGVEVLAGTTVNVTLRDCPDAAAGRQVWAFTAINGPRRFDFPRPIPYHTGLHATISGTGPSVKFLIGAGE